jgi:hypothetical protein
MYVPYIEEWAAKNKLLDEYTRLGANKFEVKHVEALEVFYKTKVEDVLKKIPMLPSNYLVVLDEAQNFIGANDHKERKNIDFFEYATIHRQRGHELLIVTQHEDNVDVKIRRIANLLVYLFRRDVLGMLFRDSVTERHYAGCSAGTPELLTKFVTKYDKRLFKLYRSYAGDNIVEHRKFRSVWRNWRFVLLAAVFVVGASRVPVFLNSWFFSKKPAAKISAPAAKSDPSAYLGVFKDYYCGDTLYVLRHSGNVEFWQTDGVPVYVCPYKNYQFNSGVSK